MRQWIPLDLRNIEDQYTRAQLRKLNEFMPDLAASLASSDLVPQTPDSITIFNNILQKIVSAGFDPRILAFFDDFTSEPGTDPFPGASGVWRLGGSGGSSLLADTANLDPRGVGVWEFASGTTAGGAHLTISPTSGANFNLNLIPKLRFGFSLRVHPSLFTRGHLMVNLSNMDLSSSAINDGTESVTFGLWNTDVGYPLNVDPEIDTLYFRARHGGNDSISKFGVASTFTSFKNVEIRVTGEQAVELFIDGASQGTLSGSAVPPSTQALALRIRMETRGGSNPAESQKSYLDRVWIDTRDIDRGTI